MREFVEISRNIGQPLKISGRESKPAPLSKLYLFYRIVGGPDFLSNHVSWGPTAVVQLKAGGGYICTRVKHVHRQTFIHNFIGRRRASPWNYSTPDDLCIDNVTVYREAISGYYIGLYRAIHAVATRYILRIHQLVRGFPRPVVSNPSMMMHISIM